MAKCRKIKGCEMEIVVSRKSAKLRSTVDRWSLIGTHCWKRHWENFLSKHLFLWRTEMSSQWLSTEMFNNYVSEWYQCIALVLVPIFANVTSLAASRSCDCANASETILKYSYSIYMNPPINILVNIKQSAILLCADLGVYCVSMSFTRSRLSDVYAIYASVNGDIISSGNGLPQV